MSRKSSGDGAIGIIAIMIFAVFIMPFVGFYLARAGSTEDERFWGVIILIVGIFMWLAVGIGSSAY